MYASPEEAFGGTRPLLSLIESIYSAVQDATLWPVILDGIGEAASCEQTLLFATLSDTQVPDALYNSKTDPEVVHSFVRYYASVNVLAEPCDRMFPDGVVRYSHWAVPDKEFENSEFYCDFFRPRQMHYSFGLKVPIEGRPAAYLSCQRSKSKGPFSEREGVILQTLLPHLQRAFMLHLQLTQMQSGMMALGAALDSYEHTVFGFDRAGKIVLSNRRAEELVRFADGLFVSGGDLGASFPEQNRRLQKALSEAVATGAGLGLASGTSLLIDRKSGKNPLRLTVTPFISRLPGTSMQLAALVFVSDPMAQPQSRGTVLRALYALTPTETRVADLLLQGLEVREVGTALGMSLETARFHTKRVLHKTGARRQTELIKLMLSLPLI